MAKRSKSVWQMPVSPLTVIVILAVALFIFLVALTRGSTENRSQARTNTTGTVALGGNGAPSGAHYNLNIIGVPKGKTADMTGSSGHRIFVPLVGKCKINLSPGDFLVVDGNCTDNGQASFQLPNPDPDNNGITEYSVWARALGKPGGSSTTTTCATDPSTGEVWCSVYSMVAVRNKGQSSFTDVSRQLLYIYADINQDGTLERYNLFNDALQDYYWNYDNNGLKLLQLRFYPIASNVNAAQDLVQP
jgi:hypothetical protein